jgi:oleate hydratase
MTNVDRSKTTVYLVGSGIASLASAVYLIKDAHILGKNIHILEQDELPGGALDGSGNKNKGYLTRGGRMHEKHYVCTWDLLSNIPTLEDPNITVKEQTFAFNEKFVSDAHARLLKAGRIMDVSSYGLSLKDKAYMLELILHTHEEALGNQRIEDWFTPDFFETIFWMIWNSMFAFQKWSSLVEMRRYFIRFIHLLPEFQKLGGILRTAYNQYDAVVRPTRKWLEARGVQFEMSCPETKISRQVVDIDFDFDGNKKTATIIRLKNGDEIGLTATDYVFITNGSMVDCSNTGSMTEAPILKSKEESGSWMLWERIAKKHADFGNPGVFSDNIALQKWMSFTVTLKNPAFFRWMQDFSGNLAGTGGLVTLTDSSWGMSVVMERQPYFIDQPDDVQIFWGDGLYPDRIGDFVTKKMSDCNGKEILIELFSHLKIKDQMKDTLASEDTQCLPVMMPFIDSEFMPRSLGDRPKVIPDGSTNFAFLGQFTEIPDDCVFTVEYSVRSAQIAVFSLFNTGKEPLPVYQGIYDPLVVIRAIEAINR